MIEKVINILRRRGMTGLMSAVYFRRRHLLSIRTASFHNIENLLQGKNRIEIGGPSQVFPSKGIFPVYPVAGHLDNCNFGGTTVWEGDIVEGMSFQFDRNKPEGRQFIVEATAMGWLTSSNYDFVLFSHVLEHTVTPTFVVRIRMI